MRLFGISMDLSKSTVLPKNLVMVDFAKRNFDEMEEAIRFNSSKAEFSELIYRFNEIVLKRLDNAQRVINEHKILEKLIWEGK